MVSATRATRQFTIRYLLLITAIAAASLAPAVWWKDGELTPAILLFTVGILLLYHRYVIAAALFLVACLVLLPSFGPDHSSVRRAQCVNHMKQIALAIVEYESVNGHLPPPYTMDDEGNPLHSWRVLILPYLECQNLYDAIDLSKPWHHPANLALQYQMPDVYRCPNFEPDASQLAVTTAYVAIIGDHTAWPRTGKRSIRDITDGISNTVALLESEQHRLHWMSTADPEIEMVRQVDTLLSKSNHQSGVAYCRCDGSVRWLDDDVDDHGLFALITIDDGETSK